MSFKLIRARAVRFSLIACALVACDDDGEPALGDASALDAFQPPWATPRPGDNKAWDIQLAAPFDTTATHAMYVLDLWDVTPAGIVLDYGDGTPITTTAGPIAGRVAELKARTPAPLVVCHIDTGAIALDDPDAAKFPGFEANPPDNPTDPAVGSVIGWSTIDSKRYLDTRAAARAMWEPIMRKRFDHARDLGCDGVDAHHNDGVGKSTAGFDIAGTDAVAWAQKVAEELHTRVIGAGYRATTDAGSLLADGLLDPANDTLSIDFVIFDRCGEFQICDRAQGYLRDNRAVYALDYQPDGNGNGVSSTTACERHDPQMDGLHKDDPPDGDYREECP